MDSNRWQVILALVCFAVILMSSGAVLWMFFWPRLKVLATATVGETVVRVEVAASPGARARGLSGHAPLAADEGMIFIFPEAGWPSFWMKGMRFPLDIIWINDNRVVEVTADVPTPSGSGSLPLYAPKEPADKALEVPAGFARANDVALGDLVRIEIVP